jgi:hypothetical protein
LSRFQLPAPAPIAGNDLESQNKETSMTAIIYHFPTQRRNNSHLPAVDPVLSAAEEMKRLELVLANLPDGDEADAIIDKITECELRIISQPPRTSDGLVAQIDLLNRWIREACPFRAA